MGIFKTYDIRGIFGEELTPKETYLIGYYLVKHLNLNEVKVGHDLRLSYKVLTKFLIQGMLDAKCEVIYLGKCSTPNFYHSLFKEEDSGVMITASHNAKEYNGFKIIHKGNSFDARNGLKDLEKLVKKDDENKKNDLDLIFDSIEEIEVDDFLKERGLKKNSPIEEYIGFLKLFFDLTLIQEEKDVLKDKKISLDFSSGVSSIGVVPFLEDVQIKHDFINEVPDGYFPFHSPDPLKAKEFIYNREKKGSLFTAVFDGDGDRIVFFDENGEFIFPDYIICAFIDFFSKSKVNRNFVCDLRTSKYVSDFAKKRGIDVKLLRVGRAFYQDYMKEHSCKYGAELSGHMFFRDFHNLDNPDIALIYMLKIIAQEIMKNPDFKFSKFISKYMKYCKIEETNLTVKNSDKTLKMLHDKYKDKIVLEIDGVSFDFGDYWFNIRKSNTEPVVRINFEGVDKKKTKEEFDKLIGLIGS